MSSRHLLFPLLLLLVAIPPTASAATPPRHENWLTSSTAELATGLREVRGALPRLREAASTPEVQAELAQAGYDVALVFGTGIASGIAAALALQRPRRGLRQMAPAQRPAVFAILAVRAILAIIPGATVMLAVRAALAFVDGDLRTDLISLALADGVGFGMIGIALLRILFSTRTRARRPIPLDDHQARIAYRWCGRLVLTLAIGSALVGIVDAIDAPPAVANFVARSFWLLAGVLAVLFILRARGRVATLLAGDTTIPARNIWQELRRRIAETWHVIAIFYLGTTYFVWAARVEGGVAYLLSGTVLSLLAGLLARLALIGADHLSPRLGASRFLAPDRYPLLAPRLAGYLPIVAVVIRGLIIVTATLAVFAAWRVDALGYIRTSPLALLVLPNLLGLVLITVLAVVALELVNLAITYFLTPGAGDIRGPGFRRRLPTLVPLARNTATIAILVMASLTALSQVGINVAPLLAGAGVVGLAIGFGAQSLVKDVITGAFILIEDTVNVGDVAVINGTGGLVEGMTVRTIRLRDETGTVYTIPFGSITTIGNMTKDFSYYVIDIGVSYKADTDRVIEVLREIFSGLRTDPAFSSYIIGEFDVLGVDRFADSAVQIKARIKTLPIRQWAVGREFNRRLKRRFDELQIEIPNPHQIVVTDTSSQKAPEGPASVTANGGDTHPA